MCRNKPSCSIYIAFCTTSFENITISTCFTLQGFAHLPPVLRANRKVAALRSARNTLPATRCPNTGGKQK
jgi:hypothetical protein